MTTLKKLKKRRRKPAKLSARAPRKSVNAESNPNENLRKFPDETYGDMERPFARR